MYNELLANKNNISRMRLLFHRGQTFDNICPEEPLWSIVISSSKTLVVGFGTLTTIVKRSFLKVTHNNKLISIELRWRIFARLVLELQWCWMLHDTSRWCRQTAGSPSYIMSALTRNCEFAGQTLIYCAKKGGQSLFLSPTLFHRFMSDRFGMALSYFTLSTLGFEFSCYFTNYFISVDYTNDKV